MIHVFIGTKAQYIKTSPLLRLMDSRSVDYRLIDSGQHAALSVDLRRELGVRPPDHVLGGDRDVTSIPQALTWSAGLAGRLWSGSRLRNEVFGGTDGVCVVHGDTPSTLLSTLMARRAGLRVAHMEAGLRSHRLFHPFPEESIRVVVMRLAHILFAPDEQAVANLAATNVKGRVVPLAGNTSIEAVRHAASDVELGSGPAIFTMHRVENLHRRARVDGFVDMVEEAATDGPVRVVLHEPTENVLESAGHLGRLRDAGVELTGLAPHGEFVQMLAAAPYVVTDGGSIQEECALLGVPTLLWRDRSERANGIGRNVVVSRYESEAVTAFIDDADRFRVERSLPEVRPSAQMLDVLLDLR